MLGNQMQQQQFAAAAMMPGMTNLSATMLGNPPAGFNPLAMAAAAGMKAEDANIFLNNLLKTGGMPNMLAGIKYEPGIGGIPNATPLPNSLVPGTSSASVPPLTGDESRHSGNALSRATSSSARPRSSADSPNTNNNTNNRGTPSASATPTLLKRTKFEPEEVDGELEIDVQNDAEPAPSVSHTNGNSVKAHKDGRESAHSTSSRDSTTPSSRKRVRNFKKI